MNKKYKVLNEKKKKGSFTVFDTCYFSPFCCIKTYVKICDSFLFLLHNISLWTHPFPTMIMKEDRSCRNFGSTKYNQKEIKFEFFAI